MSPVIFLIKIKTIDKDIIDKMMFRFIGGLKSWSMLIYEYTRFIDINGEFGKN